MSVRGGLLAILSRGKTHGYQMKLDLETVTGDTWQINIGQVYTTLRRLERDGLVESRETDDQGRVHYSITPAGSASLGEWMASPVNIAAAGRDEISLKILLAISTRVEDARRVVAIQRGSTMGVLQDYMALKVADPEAELPWLLHLDRLIFSAEAELRWLDLVESRLEQLPELKQPDPNDNDELHREVTK